MLFANEHAFCNHLNISQFEATTTTTTTTNYYYGFCLTCLFFPTLLHVRLGPQGRICRVCWSRFTTGRIPSCCLSTVSNSFEETACNQLCR